MRRELANISTVLIPWEHRIKEIESHFGSVVASYFTFLRWLFWVNIVIAVVLTAFVVTPELLALDPHTANDSRKQMLPEESAVASNLITIWDFEGYLKYSPLFYGYYHIMDINVEISFNLTLCFRYYSDSAVEKKLGYKLPLAYFLTGLVVYIYSFVATLRKYVFNFLIFLYLLITQLIFYLKEWQKIRECLSYHQKRMNVFLLGNFLLDGIL